jgi:HCOMODA/2-hydroxy-3-carboxy-muconic semialdehyde decarboxylase
VVGNSIQQAVYRAVYTERNAELQHRAMQLGTVTYLTDGEAHATSLSNDEHLGRPWEIWKQRAGVA